MRRNSPEFRKNIRKTAKAHAKKQEAQAEAEKKELKNKLHALVKNSLAEDPLPTDLKAQETFFVQEVGRADELTKASDEASLQEAALAFYRALRVYPNPVDLLGIFDKSVKQPVLDYIRTMIVLEPPPALASVLSSSTSSSVSGIEEVDI